MLCRKKTKCIRLSIRFVPGVRISRWRLWWWWSLPRNRIVTRHQWARGDRVRLLFIIIIQYCTSTTAYNIIATRTLRLLQSFAALSRARPQYLGPRGRACKECRTRISLQRTSLSPCNNVTAGRIYGIYTAVSRAPRGTFTKIPWNPFRTRTQKHVSVVLPSRRTSRYPYAATAPNRAYTECYDGARDGLLRGFCCAFAVFSDIFLSFSPILR